MRKCPACSFVNEQWDERCQRCNAALAALEQPDVDSTVAGAAQQDAAAETAYDDLPLRPATAGPVVAVPVIPAKRPASQVERIAVVVIVLCILGLIGVAFAAWQRGMLAVPGVDNPSGAGARADDADAVLDPLGALLKARVRNIKQFRSTITLLQQTEADLARFAFTNSAPGELSAESLAALDEVALIGDSLTAGYREFEERAVRYDSAELTEPKLIIREAFATRFGQLLQLVGSAYSMDLKGVHKAYLFSDSVPALLAEHKQIDPVPIKAKWDEALHNREQYELDLEYEDIYVEIAARYDALVVMHQQMKQAIDAIPPEKSRSGIIDTNSISLLELYHELMTKVEDASVEFEEYLDSLGDIRRSDKMNEQIEEFEKLAQQDHLFGFTETYKTYESDRELTHEAYSWLELHFEFVREHWPDVAPSYRQVYTYYEDRWERFWTNDGSGPESLEP